MGASRINPLPPHTRCPACGCVHLHPEVSDGFDLEMEKCECGELMEGDGHEIPLESDTQRSGGKGLSIEIRVPEDMISLLGDEVQEYFRDAFQVVPMKYDDSVLRYELFPSGKPTPICGPSGVAEISYEEWYQSYRDMDSVLLIPRPAITAGKSHVSKDDLQALRARVLQGLLDSRISEKQNECRELIAAAEALPLTFSNLLRIIGMCLGTGIWEGNGAALVKSGKVQFSELPVFREDIWNMVLQCSELPGSTGAGIAAQYMKNAAHGRFSTGKAKVNRAELQNLNCPSWLADYLQKVRYMFPKGHCVELLLREATMLDGESN